MDIINGKVYRHFKGGYVLVIATAKHSDKDEELVIYKGLNNGKIYARPIESFVEIVTDSEGNKVPRLTLATDTEVSDLLSASDIASIDELVKYINTAK